MVFVFNDTATTEIYTLSLHDALPIYDQIEASRGEHVRELDPVVEPGHFALACERPAQGAGPPQLAPQSGEPFRIARGESAPRSEEHTSELQSRQYLVCRLLLEKKKKI